MSESDAAHLILASSVIGAILLGALAMVADAHRNPHCPECYHCRRKEQDRKDARAQRGHEDYHYWTDRRPWECHDPKCPGR